MTEKRTVRDKIKEIVKINVDYVSNKDGINYKDSQHLPEALAYQLVKMIDDEIQEIRKAKEDESYKSGYWAGISDKKNGVPIRKAEVMGVEELYQLLAMSKSNFRNPNHYTLAEQERMTRQDAINLHAEMLKRIGGEMSNNDLFCPKCKSHHHPVECPLDEVAGKTIREILDVVVHGCYDGNKNLCEVFDQAEAEIKALMDEEELAILLVQQYCLPKHEKKIVDPELAQDQARAIKQWWEGK